MNWNTINCIGCGPMHCIALPCIAMMNKAGDMRHLTCDTCLIFLLFVALKFLDIFDVGAIIRTPPKI